MTVFFSALVIALAILFSTRYSFEPLYIPPVRGEGLLQGIKVGEEKAVWILDGWTGRVRLCRLQDTQRGDEEIVCSAWGGGLFDTGLPSPRQKE